MAGRVVQVVKGLRLAVEDELAAVVDLVRVHPGELVALGVVGPVAGAELGPGAVVLALLRVGSVVGDDAVVLEQVEGDGLAVEVVGVVAALAVAVDVEGLPDVLAQDARDEEGLGEGEGGGLHTGWVSGGEYKRMMVGDERMKRRRDDEDGMGILEETDGLDAFL